MAILVYVALLHYSYKELVAPYFAYAGYTYREPIWDLYLYAIAMVVMIGLVLPRRLKRPSDAVLWFIYTIAVTPSVLMPQYSRVLSPERAIVVSLFIATCFAGVVILNHKASNTRLVPTARISSTSFWIAISLFSILFYTYMLASIGVNLQLVSLTDVYDVRGDYVAEVATGAPGIAYLLSLQSNIVNPVIIVRGMHTRRISILLIGVLGQLLIYGSTGFRAVLLSTPLILLVYSMFRKGSHPHGATILFGVVVAAVLATGVDRVFATITWTSLIIRRLIFAPGLLSAVYFDVFQTMPQAHLGHSILRGIVPYPYSETPASVVGRTYFQRSDMSANANIFADGFMNFGYAGTAVAAVLLLLILRVADGVSSGLPVSVATSLLIMPSISLANSGILTTLVSHGLLATLALLALLPRDGWTRRECTETYLDP